MARPTGGDESQPKGETMTPKQDRYWAHLTGFRPLPDDKAIIMEWFEEGPYVADPRFLRRERRRARKEARRARRKSCQA